MIHVLFLIRSLDTGGSERQLTELSKAINKNKFIITVVTLYDGGALRDELNDVKGVNLISLHKKGRWDVLSQKRFWQIVRTSQPDIIYSFLPGCNLIALLIGKLLGKKIVWGIRASNMDLKQYTRDFLPMIIFFLQKELSYFPNLIIANSFAGQKYHLECGYHGKQMMVIPNGIDTNRFRPNQLDRIRLRGEWDIRDDEHLVGIVARLDPMKGYETFLEMVVLLSKQDLKIQFVCIGDGPEKYKQSLYTKAKNLGIGSRLTWVGNWRDMPAAYNALDIVVSSSSYGEGFSNTIGEAMACGVPCIVTDVGDSALIVGELGQVVPPKQPDLLANATAELLEKFAIVDHEEIRQHIVQHFSLDLMVEETEKALLTVYSSS